MRLHRLAVSYIYIIPTRDSISSLANGQFNRFKIIKIRFFSTNDRRDELCVRVSKDVSYVDTTNTSCVVSLGDIGTVSGARPKAQLTSTRT